MPYTAVEPRPYDFTKRCAREEAVQYVDVMSLYQYVCKYNKFPVGHPVIQVGDACQ